MTFKLIYNTCLRSRLPARSLANRLHVQSISLQARKFTATAAQVVEVEQEEPSSTKPEQRSWTSYADRLNPMILDTMQRVFKYETLSPVQQEIIDRMPIQNDLLVRSKTGTGKTLAFLVPALQRTLEHFDKLDIQGPALKRYANQNASVLVVSPTRELATQIASELRKLVSVRGGNMQALCLIGGDSKRAQMKGMYRDRNDFIIGTPGRLVDMITNDPDFLDRIKSVHTLILDEADTLLEMNFKTELDTIIEALSGRKQTYMFSATVSREIQRIVRRYLAKDHTFINTVNANETDVHPHISQKYIIRPSHEHVKTVLSLIISKQIAEQKAKIIVFLPTTKMTLLYASVFRTLHRLLVNQACQFFDIHSNRTQESRTRISKAFRTSNSGSVLFTTDVSARGVDYPGVSQVIQVGAPQSRDLYVHRVGRTGRAGADGEGILILDPFEDGFLRTLGREIPISEMEFPDSEIALGPAQEKVFALMRRILPTELLVDAYLASGGAYLPRSAEFRIQKEQMIEAFQAWFREFDEKTRIPEFNRHLLGSPRPRMRDRGREEYRDRSRFERTPRQSFGRERRGGYR